MSPLEAFEVVHNHMLDPCLRCRGYDRILSERILFLVPFDHPLKLYNFGRRTPSFFS
jgi:hypothetical protein